MHCYCDFEEIKKREKSSKGIFRCTACGHSRLIDEPDENELQSIYNFSYYTSWGDTKDGEPYWEMKKALTNRLLKKLNIFDTPLHVLDVGCATGASLSAITERGWLAVGVDRNSYAVMKAREHVPGADIIEGKIEDVKKKYNSEFHLILLLDVLEHVRYPQKVIRAAYDLLLPGGMAIILTPDINSFSAKLMAGKWIHLKREHLNYFSKKSLRRLLESHGFSVQLTETFAKPITLEYAFYQFNIYTNRIITPIFTLAKMLFPKKLQRLIFNVPMGEMIAIGIKR